MSSSATLRGQFTELNAITDFRKLFFARVISNFGNGLAPIALAFGVLELPGGDAGSLSLVTTSQMVPLVAFMLFGGVAADRFGRARLVGSADVVGSVLVAISALAFISGNASVLLLCINGFLFGVLNALWYPAYSGLAPQIVPKNLLQSANSALGLGSNLSFTIGTSVAGVVVATMGSGPALLIDAISFFVAGLIVYSMRHLDTNPDVEPDDRTSIISQLREGWHEVSSRKWILVCVGAGAFFQMCFEGFLGVIAPVQAKEALNGARSMGYMMSGFGAGGIFGTFVAFRLRPRRQLLLAVGVMPLMSLWMFALAGPLSIWVLVACAFFAGIALDVMYANWMTTLHTHVPEESMSRVGAYDAFGSLAFAPLGLFFAGTLIHLIGVQSALITVGSVALVATLIPLLSREVRHLERRDA
jgi:MFS family permease